MNGDGIRDFHLFLQVHWPGDYVEFNRLTFKLAPTPGNGVIVSDYYPVLLPAGFEVAAQLPQAFAWGSDEQWLLSFKDPWPAAAPLSDFKGPLHEMAAGMIGLRFEAGDGTHYGWVRLEREDLDKYPWFKLHIREVGFQPEPEQPLVVGTHPPRPDDLPEVEPVDLNGDRVIDLSIYRRIEPNADGSAEFWRVWLDGPALEVLTGRSGDELVVVGLREQQRLPWSLPRDQAWRPLSTRPLLLSGWRATGEPGEGVEPQTEEPAVGPLAGRLGTFIGLRVSQFGRMAWVKVNGDGTVLDYAWLCDGAGVAGEPPVTRGDWDDRTVAIHDLAGDLAMDVVLREEHSVGSSEELDAGHFYETANLVMIALGGAEVVAAAWTRISPVSLEPGQPLSSSLPEGQQWRIAPPLDVWIQVRETMVWAGGSSSFLWPPEGLAATEPVFIGLRFPVGEQWRYGWVQVSRDGVLDYGMAADLDTPNQVGENSTYKGFHLDIQQRDHEIRVTWDPLYRWFDLEGSTGLEEDAVWLPLVKANATTGLSAGEYRALLAWSTPRFYRLRQNCPAGGCKP